MRADDIAEVAGIIRDVAPTGIDLHGRTRDHIARDLLEADGMHPTPAGQRLILTRIVAALAPGPGSAGGPG